MSAHERTREWRLVVACARHAAGLADARGIAAAAALIDDWASAERLACAHGLLPWLALLGFMNIGFGALGAPLALVGMVLFENAYVQAGQSVPLA